jgi:hypothetical protein
MRLLLQILSLSDRYDRKARLLPGLLAAFVPAVVIGLLLQETAGWGGAAGSAAIELFLAAVLAQVARARGKRLEETLWADWGGPPSTRWLRPWDETCSNQVKSRWRGAIKTLTDITVPASIGGDRTEADADRVIADATRQLRYVLRSHPQAGLLATHNEEYGLARNLCALRWHWLALSLLSLAGCGVAFAFGLTPYLALAAAAAGTLVAALLVGELPGYVRRCADRYAESLFAAALTAAADHPTPSSPPAPPSPSSAA